MALNFSIFLCPPEPLLQYPYVRAQWIPVRKSPRKILHSELVNCWSTLGQCIANSRPHQKLRKPSLRRTLVGTQSKLEFYEVGWLPSFQCYYLEGRSSRKAGAALSVFFCCWRRVCYDCGCTCRSFDDKGSPSAKAKRGRREGDEKKDVTTICDKRHDNLRHFTTSCDILWQFPPSLCSIDIKRHKTSSILKTFVITCHDNLREVTTIYDIFCLIPFLLSPFGFHRVHQHTIQDIIFLDHSRDLNFFCAANLFGTSKCEYSKCTSAVPCNLLISFGLGPYLRRVACNCKNLNRFAEISLPNHVLGILLH